MPRQFIRRFLPSAEALRAKRSLRWLGPLLARPWLWHFSRRSVAAGVGIGVFFGFMIPILQIAFAAVFALVLRANLPVAAVSTLVSNPLTYAPIAVAAYRVGAALLGEPADESNAAAIEAGAEQAEVLAQSAWQRFAAIGKPLMLGLATFAVAGGASAYVATLLLWRLAVLWRLRLRRSRRGRGNA
ncbi:MAG: DUF2062 domain-containing protein [Betaproteobacteria bacterium]|nr:DUF2062 domain-containing protein [Betaproteobacteria bacterium]